MKQGQLKLKAPTVALEVRHLVSDELVKRIDLRAGERYIERCLMGLLRNMDTTKYYVLEATK